MQVLKVRSNQCVWELSTKLCVTHKIGNIILIYSIIFLYRLLYITPNVHAPAFEDHNKRFWDACEKRMVLVISIFTLAITNTIQFSL